MEATQDKTYNGWTNYETWNVALWIVNEEPSYRYWRERAQECRELALASESETYNMRTPEGLLADALKEEVTDAAPDLGASTYADLLGAALSEVDWYEIARSILRES